MVAPVRNPRIHLLAACLLAALVSFFTYQRNLDLCFTASDSITLIETARIESFGDLGRVLGERMMDHTSFPGRLFRPVSTLSFSLDYWLWGLNPYGYHLVNIGLHMIATVLVVLITATLSRGGVRTALAAGLIFCTHPILVETVPAVARRQDILEFLFCALAYLVFASAHSRGSLSRWSLTVSAICFFLALGSKETAVYFPGLIAGHVFLTEDPAVTSLRRRAGLAFRAARPFLLVLIAFLVWRTWVLQGAGTVFLGSSFSRIVLSYLIGLGYPQDFLQMGAALGPLARWITALCGSVLLVLAARRVLPDRPARRAPAISLLWLGLPLAPLLGARCFDFRDLYTTVAPFSILVALILSQTLKQTVNILRRPRLGPQTGGHNRKLVCAGGLAAACLFLVISLGTFSPLFRDYSDWKDSGRLQATILARMQEESSSLPPDASLRIRSLPASLAARNRGELRTRSVSYLREYTIESWLRLARPESGVQVEVADWVRWPGPPRDVAVTTRPEPGNVFAMEVRGEF